MDFTDLYRLQSLHSKMAFYFSAMLLNRYAVMPTLLNINFKIYCVYRKSMNNSQNVFKTQQELRKQAEWAPTFAARVWNPFHWGKINKILRQTFLLLQCKNISPSGHGCAYFLIMEICDSLSLQTHLLRVYSSSVLFGKFIQNTLKTITDQLS